MKRRFSIVCIVLLVAILATSLLSCSKYSALKKAFEKEGYTENEKTEETTEALKKELEKEDFVVEFHLLTKNLTSALIVEFKNTDDLKQAMKDSDTLKGFAKDVSSSEDLQAVYDKLVEEGYACGNCFVVPISILHVDEITSIVKSV